MRFFIFATFWMLMLLLPASAACDGDACLNGIMRVCTRLPSGDTVWINKTPFEKCQTTPKQAAEKTRPAIKYNYPPKRKPIDVPSPQLSAAERAAAGSVHRCALNKNACQTPVCNIDYNLGGVRLFYTQEIYQCPHACPSCSGDDACAAAFADCKLVSSHTYPPGHDQLYCSPCAKK